MSYDPSAYTGRYRLLLPFICARFQAGETHIQIAEGMRLWWMRHDRDLNECPAADMVRYILRKVGLVKLSEAAPSAYVKPSPERDAQIYELRKSSGLKFREIGRRFGICGQRVKEICDRAARKDASEARKAAIRQQRAVTRIANPVSRPIDMGGIRDEWQTWTPEKQEAEFAAAYGVLG